MSSARDLGEGSTPSIDGPPTLRAGTGRLHFEPSDVVAERFVVTRLLGRGGMGQVYEAHDVELGHAVALKVLRPELARQPSAVLRFRAEARLAKRVTHRNVCRVFDLFHHRTAGADDLLVLAMELLDGETLAAYLRRRGPLPPDEALSLLDQIAAGVEASHDAGVVHLDLEARNVFIVREGEGERVVVADYGLARARADRARDEDASPRERAGSAPDEPGQHVAATADVAALAKIARELVAGSADSDLALPRSWQRSLRRASGGETRGCPTSASDLVAELHAAPARRRRWRLLAVALACVALALAASRLRAPAGVSSPPAPSAPSPPTVAYVAVVASPGDLEGPGASALQTLNSLLANRLSADDSVRVLQGLRPDRVYAGLRRDPSLCRGACLDALAAALGASHAVVTAWSGPPGELTRLTVVARDIRRGVSLRWIEPGGEEALETLAQQAARGLRARFGFVEPRPTELQAWRALLPDDPKLLRQHTMALRALEGGDPETALPILRGIATTASSFVMGRVALADALYELGYFRRAAAEYTALLPLAAGLPQSQILLVQARAHEAAFRWQAAAAIYQSMVEAFPEDPSYALALARVRIAAGQGREALEIVDRLAVARSLARPDCRVHLAEASAARAISDWPRVQKAARRAAEEAGWESSRLLELSARGLLANALVEQGAFGEAEELLLATLADAKEAGSLVTEGAALRNLAHLLRQQGRLAEAAARYEEAIRIARRLGNPSQEAFARRGLGILEARMGRPREALASHRRALAEFEAAGYLSYQALTLSSIAILLQRQGDTGAALELLEEGAHLAMRGGSDQTLAVISNNAGLMRWRLGDTALAARDLERGAAALTRIGDALAPEAWVNLALLQVERAELEEATASLRHGRPLRNERPQSMAWWLRADAVVRAARGQTDQAEAMLLEAARRFDAVLEPQGAAFARLNLADLSLQAGHHQRAADHLAAADTACAKAGDESCRHEAALMAAELALVTGDRTRLIASMARIGETPDLHLTLHRERLEALSAVEETGPVAALERLRSVARRASTAGLEVMALRARLDGGRLLVRAGQRGAAMAELALLERRASERGLLALAARSRELRRQSSPSAPLPPRTARDKGTSAPP